MVTETNHDRLSSAQHQKPFTLKFLTVLAMAGCQQLHKHAARGATNVKSTAGTLLPSGESSVLSVGCVFPAWDPHRTHRHEKP
mmetsp:Transcript_101963/g.186249  ORF Transcript_101963/g.186249 Transcript_101963/m.186249 type:complete len:83 (-) Transcript_101963:6-254(-)